METILAPFQTRVAQWAAACFGIAIASDKVERNHRFLEEALELVQATGTSASEAHQLVDYVYGRATGEPSQEVGGVMLTLAALCEAHDLDMANCGDTELERVWQKIELIRAKQAAKPAHSPLPIKAPSCLIRRINILFSAMTICVSFLIFVMLLSVWVLPPALALPFSAFITPACAFIVCVMGTLATRPDPSDEGNSP